MTTTERIQVGIGIVLDGDEVLVTRRDSQSSFAGYDEFPGGHREQGESLEECVVREVREETGLDVAVDRALALVQRDTPDGQLELHFFLCRLLLDRPATIPGSALDPRWVPRSSLSGLQFPDANRVVVEQLCDQRAEEAEG